MCWWKKFKLNIFLRNGGFLPADLKLETYDNIKRSIDKMEYEEHWWSLCADRKVVAVVTGFRNVI